MPGQDSPEKLSAQFAPLKGNLPRDLTSEARCKAFNSRLIRAVAKGDIGTARAATITQLLKVQIKLIELTKGEETAKVRDMDTAEIIRLIQQDEDSRKTA